MMIPEEHGGSVGAGRDAKIEEVPVNEKGRDF